MATELSYPSEKRAIVSVTLWLAFQHVMSPFGSVLNYGVYIFIQILLEFGFEWELFQSYQSFSEACVSLGAFSMLVAHWGYMIGFVTFTCAPQEPLMDGKIT